MINSRLPFLFHSMVACGDSSRYVLLRPGSHQLYRLLPHLDDHRRWTSCRHCLLVVRDLESLCPYFSTLASLALGCSYLHHFLRACLCAWPARNHARVTYSSLPLLPFCYLHFSQPAPAMPPVQEFTNSWLLGEFTTDLVSLCGGSALSLPVGGGSGARQLS